MGEYSDRYLLFVEYFNSKKFMSAQTTLDKVWLEEEGKDKDFYGGLIQVAVSLYHLTNGSFEESQKSFERAKKLLSSYEEVHLDLQIGKLLGELQSLFENKVVSGVSPFELLPLLPQLSWAKPS